MTDEFERGYSLGNRDGIEFGFDLAVKRMRAMRLDYRTLPHAEFPKRWPDWKDYAEVLPSYCGCRDCVLWRSGS